MLSPNLVTRSSAPCPGSPSSSRIRILSRDPDRSQSRTSDGKSSQYEISSRLSRSSDGIFGGVAYVLQAIPKLWIPGHKETSWYNKEDRKGVLTTLSSLILGPSFSVIKVRTWSMMGGVSFGMSHRRVNDRREGQCDNNCANSSCRIPDNNELVVSEIQQEFRTYLRGRCRADMDFQNLDIVFENPASFRRSPDALYQTVKCSNSFRYQIDGTEQKTLAVISPERAHLSAR